MTTASGGSGAATCWLRALRRVIFLNFPPNRIKPIETLTSKQRAHLRGLAHPIKPVAHIGKEGITDAAVRSIEHAFHHRELLKVKVLETAPQNTRETADALAVRLKEEGVQVVQTIGRVVLLYRAHPEKPEIKLPR